MSRRFFYGTGFGNLVRKSPFMKKLFLTLSLFSAIAIGSTVSAQASAGIFYISFRMDEELMNDLTVSFNERKFLSGYSEKPVFPEELIDSVRMNIERTVSAMIDAEAKCIYKQNKKGNDITTLGMNGELEAMPVDTRKNAMNNHERNYYVRVDVNITGRGGMAITLPDGKRSRLKPAISLTITAFDEVGNKFYDKTTKLKEFGVLKSKEETSSDGSVTVRKAEILYPEDVYQMLVQVSTAFIAEHSWIEE